MSDEARGRLVTFEGPEGGGKSTQARLLARRLREAGLEVVETREPGGTPVGERIRRVLLDPDSGDIGAEAEALLVMAARAESVARVIEPAIAIGATVIGDRYADATLAYQGYGGGVDLAWLRGLNAIVTRGIVPDLTLLLDLPPESGLARRAPDEWNRLDAADLGFHRRVREGYLELAALEPRRWVVVDADGPTEAVAHTVWAAIVNRGLASASDEMGQRDGAAVLGASAAPAVDRDSPDRS